MKNFAIASILLIFSILIELSLHIQSLESPTFQANTTTVHNNSSGSPGKKLFYLYELDEVFWWRWPKNGTQKNCEETGYLAHDHAQLSGIGKPLRLEDGLFLTWHFSMFNSLYNRFIRSSRRTRNPDEASVFIIPYDLGLDGYLNPDNCAERRSCSHGLVGQLTRMLSQSKYFRRHEGRDHVVLWSLGQYHPWPRAGCDVFLKDFCRHCTVTCYWMDASKTDNRFVSMPFPGAIHWHPDIQHLPWTTSPENLRRRNLTAVYLGSTQTLNPVHTKIRRAMAQQCTDSPHCTWRKIAHTPLDSELADALSVYRQAVFCLCPPGDDPARKALFDALLMGCIPVVFEPQTLYSQYPWHLGEHAALDASVFIPGAAMRAGSLDLVAVLRAIPPAVVARKQHAIAHLAPRLTYAVPRVEELANRTDLRTAVAPWDPPFADAAEVALDGFVARAERMIRNASANVPHRVMTARQWGAEYGQVRVQVPSGDVRLKFGAAYNTANSALEASLRTLPQVLAQEEARGDTFYANLSSPQSPFAPAPLPLNSTSSNTSSSAPPHLRRHNSHGAGQGQGHGHKNRAAPGPAKDPANAHAKPRGDLFSSLSSVHS